MTSDSPNLDSNSAPDPETISSLADAEVNNSPAWQADPNPILPEAELNSVLLYLQTDSPSDPTDANPMELGLLEQRVDHAPQVQMKTEEGKLLLILPTESQQPASELSWSEIWQQMKQRLNASDRLRRPQTQVHLVAQDRLLDSRQMQEIAEALGEFQLQLKCVATSRRQTAIAAVTLGYSVEQLQPQASLNSESKTIALADALYLAMTVRSGVEIRHPGTVIIVGDINPGGMVVADGDILVWGRLRGIAHAGAKGNRECQIMALQMEPTQLRIADAVARAPEKSPLQFTPEVAHITAQGIRIAKANDFSRSQSSKIVKIQESEIS
jgi:septum site-determining protein MinC